MNNNKDNDNNLLSMEISNESSSTTGISSMEDEESNNSSKTKNSNEFIESPKRDGNDSNENINKLTSPEMDTPPESAIYNMDPTGYGKSHNIINTSFPQP